MALPAWAGRVATIELGLPSTVTGIRSVRRGKNNLASFTVGP
jgi:hypothetical protein